MLMQMALFHTLNVCLIFQCVYIYIYIYMPDLSTDRGVDQSRLAKAMVFQFSCMDVRAGLQRKLSTEELVLLN